MAVANVGDLCQENNESLIPVFIYKNYSLGYPHFFIVFRRPAVADLRLPEKIKERGYRKGCHKSSNAIVYATNTTLINAAI